MQRSDHFVPNQLERKLNIQHKKLFGEEVEEVKYPYPKETFKTQEEQDAHFLNNSYDFDKNMLPPINLMAELEEQKRERTYVGEKRNIDDPRDAPWRLKTENIIRNCIKQENLVQLYDITWNVADLNVLVEPIQGRPPVTLELITATSKALEDALMHFEVSAPHK